VRSTDSVQDIKAKLGLSDGSSLIFGTQRLEDAHSLKQYALCDGAVLEVWPVVERNPHPPALIPRLGLGRSPPCKVPNLQQFSDCKICSPVCDAKWIAEWSGGHSDRSDGSNESPRVTDRSCQLVSSLLSQSALLHKCRLSDEGDTPP